MRYRTRKNSWTRKDSIDKKDVKRLSGHVNQTFENPYVSEMDSSDTNKNTIPHMSVAEANHLNSAH